MDASTPTAADRLDLSGVPCPQNAARALMALELMAPGDVLELIVDDGEPLDNVPESVELEGHRVIARRRAAAGWRIWVRCGGG